MSNNRFTAPANPWLAAVGLPEWQLKHAKPVTSPVASQPAVQANHHNASATPLPTKSPTTSVVHDATERSQPVSAPQPAAKPRRVAPLLVIWDSNEEAAIAGAGSLPAGELGDLLANMAAAVGLTEDVIIAWAESPDDIASQLMQRNLAPKCIWHFAAGQSVAVKALPLEPSDASAQLVSSPSLREMQQNKAYKAQLWAVLKPLKDSGLWRQ